MPKQSLPEEKFRQKIKPIRLRIEGLFEKIKALRLELEKTCTHSDSREFQWHHGYGKYISGLQCNDCGSIRAWANMGPWQTREEFYKNRVKDDD